MSLRCQSSQTVHLVQCTAGSQFAVTGAAEAAGAEQVDACWRGLIWSSMPRQAKHRRWVLFQRFQEAAGLTPDSQRHDAGSVYAHCPGCGVWVLLNGVPAEAGCLLAGAENAAQTRHVRTCPVRESPTAPVKWEAFFAALATL
eukprot:124003-Chlamydomonas_euryale.AAC.3